jgi:hypothetical protein
MMGDRDKGKGVRMGRKKKTKNGNILTFICSFFCIFNLINTSFWRKLDNTIIVLYWWYRIILRDVWVNFGDFVVDEGLYMMMMGRWW